MNAFYQGNHFYYVYSKEQIDILRAQGLSAKASGRYLTQGGIKADVPLTNIDTVIDAGIEAGSSTRHLPWTSWRRRLAATSPLTR